MMSRLGIAVMVRRMKQPPRLVEALSHIKAAGNLMPMQDATVPQLDRLWDYIDGYELAKMDRVGLWHLTPEGHGILEQGESK